MSHDCRRTRSPSPSLRFLTALLCLAPPALPQGRTDYLNVETPQVKPAAIADVGGVPYLLVCNTPDNSVEIYDTTPAIPLFVMRVPVGLEPNSVVWDGLSRFYTTDFLSDSVTCVSLTKDPATDALVAKVELAAHVVDEPMHLAIDQGVLYVTSMSTHQLGRYDAATLSPITVQPMVITATPSFAVKEPRNVIVHGGLVFVLGHKGGRLFSGPNPPTLQRPYDLDVYWESLQTPALRGTVGGLGTTNASMTFDSQGDLYVAGGFAKNELIDGNVPIAPTGFVESRLWVVQDPAGVPNVLSRNLNRTLAGGEVGKAQAMALPQDVVVFEATGQPTKVFLAAFGSGKLAVVERMGGDPTQWPVRQIGIRTAPGSTNATAGPRGLVLRPAAGGLPARLYVVNRLDNSFAVVDPVGETRLATIAMQRDPTPVYIRAGRPFLYSAGFSLSGFVSCASCHSDARTDALGWNLGPSAGPGFVKEFADGPLRTTQTEVEALEITGFPEKNLLVTQSLQGLLDFEAPPPMQRFVTNAPYHWRGDRADFRAFIEGFENLLQLGAGASTVVDMIAFEEFINSVHYPPNHLQPESRAYPQPFSDPNLAGAKLGMRIYHETPLGAPTAGRSCVQCHSLPIGSNLRFTERANSPVHPLEILETPGLRGLFQKESSLDPDASSATGIQMGTNGLDHVGQRVSINGFIDGVFQVLSDSDRLAVKQFTREFDTGIAPMVGRLLRVDTGNAASSATSNRLDAFEGQARVANVGIAVRLRIPGSLPEGYWYHPTDDLYHRVGGTPISRAQLLNTVASTMGNLLFQCTPLGSERRVADRNGDSVTAPGTGPTAGTVRLLGMRANTVYRDVPQLTGNWVPGSGPGFFRWTHAEHPTPMSLHALRLFQHELLGSANLRHDAPRRFRVAGQGIVAGSKLVLHAWNGTQAPPVSGVPAQADVIPMEIPIFATNETDNGDPVWETALELAPPRYYVLMLGGSNGPGVQTALNDYYVTLPEPWTGNFDPSWNRHFVQIQNPGNNPTVTDHGWQAISLTP